MQGIKFNQDSITAILEGRKTMTRRPIKDVDKGYVFNTILDFGNNSAVFWNDTKNGNHYSLFIDPKYKIGETVRIQSHAHKDAWVSTNIAIKITNIKVERLQDISEEDCIKEGVPEWLVRRGKTTVSRFKDDIWNKLPYQAPYDWNSNPYVFVYEFEKVEEK